MRFAPDFAGDYLNCRTYIITKPANNTHNTIRIIVNILTLGDSVNNSLPTKGFGVFVIGTGTGVIVTVEVLLEAGKINVIAGKGISVVVGVTEGVVEGVKVSTGVLEVSVGTWVVVPVEAVPVARFCMEA